MTKLLDSIKSTIGLSLENFNIVFWQYKTPERKMALAMICEIKKERGLLQSTGEAYQIYSLVKGTYKINGDIAEVGTYRGGTAKIICEAKGEKNLHLFDTFTGLPNIEKIDAPHFQEGQFAASFEEVKTYLKNYQNVHFYKGVFPETAGPIENKKFSFVHLDVDIYSSTFSSLDFFYHRVSPGGMILSHDYINTPSVPKAFHDFFQDKPEPIIELSGNQCLIVKL